MLPGLDFEPLPGGKENRKGDELFGPNQVVEGFSERFFQNFGLWWGVGPSGGGVAQRLAEAPRSIGVSCTSAFGHNPWGNLERPVFSSRSSPGEKNQSTAKVSPRRRQSR
jgi:hypothetical protein